MYVSTRGIVSSNQPAVFEPPTDSSSTSSVGVDSKRSPLQLEVVDLAGQLEYFVMHSLFLSGAYGIYCFVAKLCDEGGRWRDDSVEQLASWARFVGGLADRDVALPAMAALTHADLLRPDEKSSIDTDSTLQQLQRRFSQPLQFARCQVVDYGEDSSHPADSASVRDLRSAASAMAAEYASRIWVPRSYRRAQDALRQQLQLLTESKVKRSFPVLSKADAEAAVIASDPLFVDNPELLRRAFEFMVGCGDILLLDRLGDDDGDDGGNGLVLLDPLRWFSSLLAALIGETDVSGRALSASSSSTASASSGEMTRQQLERKLRGLGYAADDMDTVLSLLVKFEICFPLRSTVDAAAPAAAALPSSSSSLLLSAVVAAAAQPATRNIAEAAAFVFPCLLPAAATDQCWASIVKPAVGRRWQCVKDSVAFPPSMFTTLQARLYKLLSVGHRSIELSRMCHPSISLRCGLYLQPGAMHRVHASCSRAHAARFT